MILLCDSREQASLMLDFPKQAGITVERRGLPTGDYACLHDWNGQVVLDPVVCERKSISDLFTSFTGNYKAEKAKLVKAQTLGLSYVLAIEVNATEIIRGHTYWAGGELRESQKSGVAMLRQLFSLCRRHGVVLWFCSSRTEMAFRLQEFFLAWERMENPPLAGPEAQRAFGIGTTEDACV